MTAVGAAQILLIVAMLVLQCSLIVTASSSHWHQQQSSSLAEAAEVDASTASIATQKMRRLRTNRLVPPRSENAEAQAAYEENFRIAASVYGQFSWRSVGTASSEGANMRGVNMRRQLSDDNESVKEYVDDSLWTVIYMLFGVAGIIGLLAICFTSDALVQYCSVCWDEPSMRAEESKPLVS